MSLHRLQASHSLGSIFHSQTLLKSPSLPIVPLILHRTATHGAQGRANKAADGPGKRLGAKKSATQLVVPNNIIFRQRGTHWFPGENCGMGRDHTIFAREKGYVTYYQDGENGRKRIGVVFERGMTLPRGPGAARRRRLGMESREMTTMATTGEEAKGVGEGRRDMSQMSKRNYMYRETNWEIGRAAERAKIPVPIYKPGDRFKAWRLRNARKARGREKWAMRREKGAMRGKGKK